MMCLMSLSLCFRASCLIGAITPVLSLLPLLFRQCHRFRLKPAWLLEVASARGRPAGGH